MVNLKRHSQARSALSGIWFARQLASTAEDHGTIGSPNAFCKLECTASTGFPQERAKDHSLGPENPSLYRVSAGFTSQAGLM